jgi:hypothetical protein
MNFAITNDTENRIIGNGEKNKILPNQQKFDRSFIFFLEIKKVNS